MNQFPIYIPSKGRSEYMVTSKALTRMGVDHYVVVEPVERPKYLAAIKNMKLKASIVDLNYSFKEDYELCDDLGLEKSTGPGPARNCAWDHSKRNGFSHHWVMDDNIAGFNRLNKNLKVPCRTSELFTAMEDFILRYKNIAMSGPNYFFFSPRKVKQEPFVTNTRIYSCNLIRNDLPFRWRGRYNEDTILSLDMLKAGWCTVQFNAFLQDKMQTQKLKGGNTSEFYHAEGVVEEGKKYSDTGTIAKSMMQVKVHPDVSKIVHKFGRVHHHVDYSSFKNNKLIKYDNAVIRDGIYNYGMELKKKNG
jgi:hypothetical protein